MSTKKSIAGRLVETGNKGTSKKQVAPSPPEFARRLIHHPDSKIAAEMIKEQAAHEADQKSGAEITTLKLDKANIDKRYEVSLTTLAQLEKKKAGTKRYIKSGAVLSGNDDEILQWKDWRRKDQILLCFVLVSLVITISIGMGNVYSNLMSSGSAVFINDPWLAVMLSSLLPISSISIKFITNFFEYDRSRRRYAQSVYALTLIAIVNWIILFGLNFTGVSSEIDWESFDKGYDTSSALVWSQLLVEMLAASALFLAAEEIYMKYSPDTYFENLEYIEIAKALKEHLIAHEALGKELSQIHGRLVELEAARQAFINERIVEYISMRARHVATLNSHSNT